MRVIHIMEATVGGDAALCQVDWERRFDLMQHHTGQHILTHAFEDKAGANTIGFHLGEEIVTIDLNKKLDSQELVNAAEIYANKIIYENRPVVARLETGENDMFRMRKAPEFIATGGLRIIEIPGIDSTACGGTHVSMTGEIGLIKIIKTSNFKNGSRVEFLCGERAFSDYQKKNSVLLTAANKLSVGYSDLTNTIERLNQDLKDQNSLIKKLRNELLFYLAEELLRQAELTDDIKFIQYILQDSDATSARWLASKLVENPQIIACIGIPGEKAQILIVRSADLQHDMNVLLKSASETLDGVRGGGRPDFVQAGGFKASMEELENAFTEARKLL